MNIGAGGSTPTQPATWSQGSGGITMIDPVGNGFAVEPRVPRVAADRFTEIGYSFILAALVAGDTGPGGYEFVGVGDSTTANPIVAFDYDTSVFAAGGAIRWADANGTHKLAIYAGTGVPNNAGGANGDFAFRSDSPGVANTRLYVKSAGAWVGIV